MKKWRRLDFMEVFRIYTFVLKLGYSIHIIKRKEGDVIVLTSNQYDKTMVYIKL